MGLSAIGQQSLFPSEPRVFEVANQRNNSKDFSFLIPTIGTLALGVIFATNVPMGVVIGMGSFAFGVVASIATSALNLPEEDRDSEYSKILMDYPLIATLAAPFLEEGFFRGCLQPLTARSIVFLVPTATAAFLGTGLSIATTVSIVATAALFGFVHIFNDHKNSHIQAAVATISGVFLGITAVQFGLAAAIAAHIVNNTLAITLFKMFTQETASSSQAAPAG